MTVLKINNYDVRIKAPLDKRSVVTNTNEIDLPFEGLITYQKNDKKLYIHDGNIFIDFLNTYLPYATNWLYGKKVNWWGDSISWGQNPDNPPNAYARPVPLIVGELLKCTVNNYAQAGLAISYDSGGICDRVLSGDTTATLNVVMAGTNDWGINRPLGVPTDTTKATIYGAIDLMCNNLQNTYPNALNVLISPMKRGDSVVNSNYPLTEVIQALKYKCEQYNVSFIDLYNGAPNYNPTIASLKSRYTSDGLHPNQSYVENILSKKLAFSILNIISNSHSTLSNGVFTFSFGNITSSEYSFTKDSNRMIKLDIHIIASAIGTGNTVLGTLPIGFKNIKTIIGGGMLTNGATFKNLPCFIDVSGNIIVITDATYVTTSDLFCSFVFRAL